MDINYNCQFVYGYKQSAEELINLYDWLWKKIALKFHIFIFSISGNLCYKTITSQNVLSEAQVKNFFVS